MKMKLFIGIILSLRSLADAAQQEPLLVLEVPANFSAFVSAYELEGKIDLAQINRERMEVVNHLFNAMSDSEKQNILDETLAYKSGQLKLAPYISHVVRLCEEHNVPLHNFPSFEQYLRYLFIIDGASATQFFS